MSFRCLSILLVLTAACDRPLPNDRVPPGIYVAPPGVSQLAICPGGAYPPCDNGVGDTGDPGGDVGPICDPIACAGSGDACTTRACDGDVCVGTPIDHTARCGARCCTPPEHATDANCNGTACGLPTCEAGYKACSATKCVPDAGCCNDAGCPADTTCRDNYCNQVTNVCAFTARNSDAYCDGSVADRCAAHKRCNATGDCIPYAAKVCEWPACHAAPTCTPADGVCHSDALLADGTTCGGTGCYANSASCSGGSCGGQAPKDCSGGVPVCNVGQCVEPSGNCIIVPLDDGAACTLADKCMVNVACQAGECRGTPKQCPASDQCRSAYCNPATGDCVEENLADGSECALVDACMKGGQCNAGVCVGQPRCASKSACMIPSCDPTDGACSEAPAADGTACEVAGCFEALCDRGVCICVARTSAEAEAPPEREGGTLVVQPKKGCQANEATPLAFMAMLALMLRRRRRR
ncbi:MAG: hypothetical protein IT381_11245 [Deltaproteobacteria bacterium]|nr:hypothetical protein [Deltaproteobacteria bacterium]